MSNRLSGKFDACPEPKVEESADFLHLLLGSERVSLVAIQPGGGLRSAVTIDACNLDRTAAWARSKGEAKLNLYFMPNLPRGYPATKVGKDDVEAARFLLMDIDPDDGESPLDCRARVMARLEGYAPKPTAVWVSGNGVQLLWKLRTPIILDGKDGPITKQIEAINKKMEADFDGDPGRNVDRLLRLPGSVNYPNPKKAARGRIPVLSEVIYCDPSLVYDLGDFGPVKAGAPVVFATDVSEAPKPTIITHVDVREHPKLKALGEDAHNKLIALADFGLTPEYSYGNDRSRAVFSLACDAVRAGLEDWEIISILIDKRYRISDHLYSRGGDVIRYARRQAHRARAFVPADQAAKGGGPNWPDLKKDMSPASTFANTQVAIQALGVYCERDTFRDKLIVGGHAILHASSELSEPACAMLRDEIIRAFGFDPGKANVYEAAFTLCIKNSFNPVLDWVSTLKWDGSPRLEMLFIKYAGAEDTPYNRAVARKFILAFVRRIRQPGCKFDYMPVLEGDQGTGKSTFWRIIAGEEYFSDQEILTQDEKTQQELLRGKTLYEISELVGFGKVTNEKFKALLSRQYDRARPAYGRTVIDVPRQPILVGTTNQTDYLRDITGNRRIWPVKTGRFDLEALSRDRDQIIAEAAEIEATGEELTLPSELIPVAQGVQLERLAVHPWAELLSGVEGEIHGDEERVSTAYLLREVLQLMPAQCTPKASADLRIAMLQLGWLGTKKKRFRGTPAWCYYRPVTRQRVDDEEPPF